MMKLSTLPDDDEATLPVTENEAGEIEMQSHSTPFRRRRILVGILLTLVVVVSVLYWDIKDTAKNYQDSLSLDQVIVNVRESSPVATADLQVNAAPRFSRIRLQGMTCQLSSGSIHVHADYHSKYHYSLKATCPDSDVETHAALLQEALTTKPTLQIQCGLRVSGWLGGLIPFRYTYNFDHLLPSKQKEVQESEQSEESDSTSDTREKVRSSSTPKEMPNPALPPDQGEEDNLSSLTDSQGSSNHGPGQAPTKETFQEHPASSIVVESWGPKIMQVRLTWFLTPAQGIVKSARLLLPALNVHLKVEEQQEAVLVRWGESEATLVSASGQHSDSLLAEIVCEHDINECPWYKPVYKTLFSKKNRPSELGSKLDLQVTVEVDAGSSFLETVLGNVHLWRLEKYVDIPVVPQEAEFGFRPSRRSLVEDGSGLNDVTADCLRISPDDDIELNFSMCLGVDASSQEEGSVFAVCNMTFYDTPLTGFGVSEWTNEADSSRFQLETRVLLDDPQDSINSGTAKVDASGNFTIGYGDLVEIDWEMSNVGSWWPFLSILLVSGTSTDDIVEVGLLDATLVFDGDELLDKATGSVYFDTDELVLKVSISDPTWSFQAELEIEGDVEVPKRQDPYAPDDYYTDDFYTDDTTLISFLRGNTTASDGDDVVWNASWNAEVWNSYYSYGYQAENSANVYETYDHFFFDMKLEESVENLLMESRFVILNVDKDSFSETTFEFEQLESYLDLILEYFRLRWGTTQYMESSGNILTDRLQESITIQFEDSARIDMEVNGDLSWFSESEESTDNRLFSNYFNATNFNGSDLYVDLANGNIGIMSDDGKRASVQLMSADGPLLHIEADMGYEWDDDLEVFVATLNQLKLEWKEDGIMDVRGNASMNFDAETISFSVVDDSVEFFQVEMASNWYSNSSDDWGLIIDQVFVKRQESVELDSSALFQYRTIHPETGIFVEEEGIPFGLFETKTLSSATMQLDMAMNFTLFEDDDFLQIMMDNCRMQFDETVYIDFTTRSVAIPDTPQPTSSPISPTESPSSPPTPGEANDAQVFDFSDIEMFLAGAPQLSFAAVEALGASIVAFYSKTYADSTTQRRLQSMGVTNFQTTVRVTGDAPTTEGNTVTYDQTISFVPSNGETVSGSEARDILLSPFQDNANKKEFEDILKSSDPSFAGVTAVDAPKVPLPDNAGTDPEKDDDNDGNMTLIIILVVVGVILCCCSAGSYVYLKRRSGSATIPKDENANESKEFNDRFDDEIERTNPNVAFTPTNQVEGNEGWDDEDEESESEEDSSGGESDEEEDQSESDGDDHEGSESEESE